MRIISPILVIASVMALESEHGLLWGEGDDETLDLDIGVYAKYATCPIGELPYVFTWHDTHVGKDACGQTCLPREVDWVMEDGVVRGECVSLGYTLFVNTARSSYVSIVSSYDLYWA